MRKLMGMAAIVFGLLLPAASVANEVVVLESTLAAFAPGQAVDGATEVDLKAGDLISVLTADGSTQMHQGPYIGPLANGAGQGWSGSLSVVSALVGEAEVERKRLGATRAFNKDDLPGSAHIDVSQSQAFCAKAAGPIHFWRPAKLNVDSEFSLSNESFGAAPLTGFWLGGDRTLQWPPGLPVPFGTTLQMRLKAKGVVTEVDLIRIPDSVDDGFGSLVWMSRQGCKAQALRVLAELRKAG